MKTLQLPSRPLAGLMVKSCPALAKFSQLSLLNAKLQWVAIEAVVAVDSEVEIVEALTAVEVVVVAAVVEVVVALMVAEIVAVLEDRATGGTTSIYFLMKVKVD